MTRGKQIVFLFLQLVSWLILCLFVFSNWVEVDAVSVIFVLSLVLFLWQDLAVDYDEFDAEFTK